MKWDKSLQNPLSLYCNYTGNSDKKGCDKKLCIFFVQKRRLLLTLQTNHILFLVDLNFIKKINSL